MDRKIRLLLVTFLPWRDDNNIGNSYSNIFANTDDKYEFAHVYIRDGMPQNKLCHEYFHISEKMLLKSFFGRRIEVGKYYHIDNCENMPKDEFSKLYNKARILRWEIFLLVRDLLGFSNSWKTDDFDKFIDSFNPDIVFGTLPSEALNYRIMKYIKERKNIPVITYPWDDYYAFNVYNYNPFSWIRRIMERHYLKKSANISKFLYVITAVMKNEYCNLFKKECKLLFKGYHFHDKRIYGQNLHNPINIVYMGNIGCGRWKTLSALAQAIKEINGHYKSTKLFLNVYTLSPKDNNILKSLNIEGASKINDPVPNDRVNETMDNADMLVHAEPFRKKDYQFYRASFSTKLVDYFFHAKAILSLGGITASTDYLIRNDATIYMEKENIATKLYEIVENPYIIQEYGQKSWNCGVNNHQIDEIQEQMYLDFKNVLKQ